MFKFVIFDLDGTLADTEELILNSFRHTYESFEKTPMHDAHIKKTFGAPLMEVLKNEFGSDYEKAAQIYRSYHLDNFENYIRLFDGAIEILQELQTMNVTMGIVTSRLTHTTTKILKKYDIEKYFKFIVTADMTERHKPDPEPLLKCLLELGATKEHAVFIGDTLYDVACAKNAGIQSMLVGWSHINGSFGEIVPDYIINSYGDIKKYVMISQ